MKVAVLTLGNPLERRYYSGTSYYAHKELLRRFPDLHLVETSLLDRFMRRANTVFRRMGVDVGREPLLTSAFSKSVRRQLAQIQPDVVVSIGATHKVAGLQTRWPLIHVSDALFGTVARYYRRYSKLSARTVRLGDLLQQQMLDNVTTLFLTSQWAVDDAISSYLIDQEKVQILPIGANFDIEPAAKTDFVPKNLKLLFVGVEWERKGGPLALEVFEIIRQKVSRATLHIVGCEPNQAKDSVGVFVHGYLRKSVEEERQTLNDLYQSSAFFIMPSHEEAFGLVYCEAAAYGLPSIALKTGGVPTVVLDGKTGLLFDEKSAPCKIAESLLDLWADPNRYKRMRHAARARYEDQLNWNAWGNRMEAEIRRISVLAKTLMS